MQPRFALLHFVFATEDRLFYASYHNYMGASQSWKTSCLYEIGGWYILDRTVKVKDSWDFISQSRAPMDFVCSTSPNEALVGATLSCSSSVKVLNILPAITQKLCGGSRDSLKPFRTAFIILIFRRLSFLSNNPLHTFTIFFSAWKLTESQLCGCHLVSSKKVHILNYLRQAFPQKLLQKMRQDSHHHDLS